ncbi:IS3 family transposase [Streptomyces spiralis]|uniref:IS3 family transposase n=1 Tax=Streptomyces spiralis TaxID=66376 RepID=UPI0036AFE738
MHHPRYRPHSFYYWRRTAGDRAARQKADAQPAARIRAVHCESDGTYGVPRITAEYRDDGERVSHKRIARVMRSIGLVGVRLRRRHCTTITDPASAKAPDLIGCDFTASEPNTKYVRGITYLPLDGGKILYLATVIDLASRRLAGWAIADHMRTDRVIDALAAAERTCDSLAGAIMLRAWPSDRWGGARSFFAIRRTGARGLRTGQLFFTCTTRCLRRYVRCSTIASSPASGS